MDSIVECFWNINAVDTFAANDVLVLSIASIR